MLCIIEFILKSASTMYNILHRTVVFMENIGRRLYPLHYKY